MVSIRKAVKSLYDKDHSIAVDDLRKVFPSIESKSLSNALSYARREGKKDLANFKKFTNITEEEIEKLLVDKANGINRGISNADINLFINFLKIKRADAGLEDDLDIAKYIKKVVIEKEKLTAVLD